MLIVSEFGPISLVDNRGKKIVTAPMESTAKIWDASTGKLLVDLREENVNSAQFSPDGEKIVTASMDSTS